MSIKDTLKAFTTSSAAVLTVAGSLVATEAQAQQREPIPYVGRNEPKSCRDYRSEVAKVDRSFEQGANRVVGGLVGGLLGRGNTGSAVGGGAGYIVGGVVSNAQRNARLNQLYNQCQSDLAYQAEGICTNTVNQTSKGRVVDGRVVGRSEGTVTERQNCERSAISHPQGGNMAGDLSGRGADVEPSVTPRSGRSGSNVSSRGESSFGQHDGSRRSGSARDRMTQPATGASAGAGETCSPITLEGKGEALLCRGRDGKSRVVELAPGM